MAKAQNKGFAHIHQLKLEAIHVRRAKYSVAWFFKVPLERSSSFKTP